MSGQTVARLLHLVLIVTSLLLAIEPGLAQKKLTKLQQITITDAAGRKHVRTVRPTFAQRRAAAKARVKAIREAAARKYSGEVKK